ncbi:glycosyltransferase family 39 protein [bacterium]|nr:glycosyltransferase family 39 protein [bacterium]
MSRSGVAGLALLALVCFFAPLGDGSLRGDSVTYAAIARRMAESGQWLDMHVGFSQQVYFNKPPLLIWLTAALFAVVGPSTFTACFWSGLFGVVSVLALYRLGREALGPRAALLAACAYTLTPDVLAKATRFRLESASALFTILALDGAFRAVRSGRPGPLIASGAAIGLCLMTKGGPGLVALACVLGFLIWARATPLMRSREAAIGLALMLALGLLWPAIQWLRHGDVYFQVAFGNQLLHRISEPRAYHPLPYLGHLLTRYWPWLPFCLLGGWQLWREERRGNPETFRLLVSWIGIAVAILSLLAGKSGRYLSSVYPAFSLLVGLWLADRVGAARADAFARVLPKLAAATAVVLVCLPFELRSDEAAGTRDLGVLLDAYQPEVDHLVAWGRLRYDVKPQIYFTLRRDLRMLRDTNREALESDPSAIALSRGGAGEQLERDGWRPLLRTKHWTAYLRPPAGDAEGPARSRYER